MSELLPPQEAHWPEDAIFTIGHSTLPIERFVVVLQAYGIELGRRKVHGSGPTASLGVDAPRN
jgi:hypothetical protein